MRPFSKPEALAVAAESMADAVQDILEQRWSDITEDTDIEEWERTDPSDARGEGVWGSYGERRSVEIAAAAKALVVSLAELWAETIPVEELERVWELREHHIDYLEKRTAERIRQLELVINLRRSQRARGEGPSLREVLQEYEDIIDSWIGADADG
jgi:hypothetical protein